MFEQKISDSKPGSWILGGGWNNDLWGGALPMASWLDDITPYNPVSHNILDFWSLNIIRVELYQAYSSCSSSFNNP